MRELVMTPDRLLAGACACRRYGHDPSLPDTLACSQLSGDDGKYI
jgi:hypothetical protein